MYRYSFQTSVSLLVFCALIESSGCEKPSGLVPVSGQVSVDGEPLTSGTIRFFPTSGRPVSSAILEDGSFQLAEVTVGQTMQDGISPGSYRIAVSASEVIDEAAEDINWLAPAKYADFRTSGLEADIDGPTYDLQIALTWEGAMAEAAEEADSDKDSLGDAAEGSEVESPAEGDSGEADAGVGNGVSDPAAEGRSSEEEEVQP